MNEWRGDSTDCYYTNFNYTFVFWQICNISGVSNDENIRNTSLFLLLCELCHRLRSYKNARHSDIFYILYLTFADTIKIRWSCWQPHNVVSGLNISHTIFPHLWETVNSPLDYFLSKKRTIPRVETAARNDVRSICICPGETVVRVNVVATTNDMKTTK